MGSRKARFNRLTGKRVGWRIGIGRSHKRPERCQYLDNREPTDIKTFVDFKKPLSDSQFAATVAYYYRFEAPEPQRKASLSSADLIDACRQTGRERLKHPAQTLVNAHTQVTWTRGASAARM
jgi:hypothetical protein